jgi:hypothetical protein
MPIDISDEQVFNNLAITGETSIGIGTYTPNETITGSLSGTTAIVKSWNAVNGELQITNDTGNFIIGETIVGSASSAIYQLSVMQDFNTVNKYPENNESLNSEYESSEFNSPSGGSPS